jgi:hypothetical protein
MKSKCIAFSGDVSGMVGKRMERGGRGGRKMERTPVRRVGGFDDGPRRRAEKFSGVRVPTAKLRARLFGHPGGVRRPGIQVCDSPSRGPAGQLPRFIFKFFLSVTDDSRKGCV